MHTRKAPSISTAQGMQLGSPSTCVQHLGLMVNAAIPRRIAQHASLLRAIRITCRLLFDNVYATHHRCDRIWQEEMQLNGWSGLPSRLSCNGGDEHLLRTVSTKLRSSCAHWNPLVSHSGCFLFCLDPLCVYRFNFSSSSSKRTGFSGMKDSSTFLKVFQGLWCSPLVGFEPEIARKCCGTSLHHAADELRLATNACLHVVRGFVALF